MYNHLKNERSPYLLQHAKDPVDWYPWDSEVFQRAKAEDKPVFLSIGYSTCHWCHVMARESFQDKEIARLFNENFLCVKVDREERPDIDAVYMAFCQAFTGSGGWPASIFLTPDQTPFFAGTYFPKESKNGGIGLRDLLPLLAAQWQHNRAALLSDARTITERLRRTQQASEKTETLDSLPEQAVALYKQTYDEKNGGFGGAPKFPAPHNLLFLMTYADRRKDAACYEMARHTLRQMARGGLFDHIGGGFYRYSTDARFLVPHFEKMLYDNALLILSYCKAYEMGQGEQDLRVAEKTAAFVLRELTNPDGGFYSALDADSGGKEGEYYLFTPREIKDVLGEQDGDAFCRRFNITHTGNFEGKSIPNLLQSDGSITPDESFDWFLEPLRQYRSGRSVLHRDEKILTQWNALMIAALSRLYQVSGKIEYLEAAKRADAFLQKELREDETLFVSFCAGRRGEKGFLDDYAACLYASLTLYDVTLRTEYLDRAEKICQSAREQFGDSKNGGFYLSGSQNEPLILRLKETYDGALPSGNSMMAYALARLALFFPEKDYAEAARRQLEFIAAEAVQYPAGYAMFLLALLEDIQPPARITAVLADKHERERLVLYLPSEAAVRALDEPQDAYRLMDGKTTYYICKGRQCLPPTQDPARFL